MCGIYGLIGNSHDAVQKVFHGLKDIEYRGYDSWGVAYWKVGDGKWKIEKEIGFLPREINFPESNLALGHTRWATHGGVTKDNAHPHSDCSGKLVLVHNGIVENFSELKKSLKKHSFKSETDSEVVIHLIEHFYRPGNLKEAVMKAFKKLDGLNALVVSDGREIIACKKGSPLVLGQTRDGFVIASDPNAILPITDKLFFLEDGQIAALNERMELFSQNGKPQRFNFTKVSWLHSSSALGNYPHFMLKEITEQPKVIKAIAEDSNQVAEVASAIKKAYGTFMIGCGSAGYACLAGVYLFSKVAKRHVNFSTGSEFNYLEDYLTSRSLLIALSQSGETIDVIEPVAAAKRKKVKILALTNTLGSTLYRLANNNLLLKAGPEKAVCATKTFIAMLSNMILLTFAVAGKANLGREILLKSSKEISRMIKNKESIKKLAEKIYKSDHIYVLGRGLSYPVALESALKIKEVSYIHAEGFAAGELKHGVIALIKKGTPVIVYVPEDEGKEAALANAMEVRARGAYVIGVAAKNNLVFDEFFKVRDCGVSSVLPNSVFAQLLGYYLAVRLGYNPDKPRNLAKSVVVR